MARQGTSRRAESDAGIATILVDKSEMRSRVPDLAVEMAELATADYVLSPAVMVERKTVDDLVNSLKFGRLFEQLARLQLACSRPILLIEGDLDRRRSQIKDEALTGLISRLLVHDGIYIAQTANTTATAALLHRMALHAQGLAGEGIRLRGPKPDMASAEVYARYLIEGLPEVGPQRVDAILRAFGSVRAAFLADPSAWAAIIGPAAAQRVWTVLNAPYGASAATATTPGTTLLAQARGAEQLPTAPAPAAAAYMGFNPARPENL